MVHTLLHFFIILPVAICSNIPVDKNLQLFNKTNKVLNITFNDYLKKFEPHKVWAKIDKTNKLMGKNKTVAEEFDAMFDGIDDIDDLLKLKVQNGNPTIKVRPAARRQFTRPYSNIGPYQGDKFVLKDRIMELIKQALYQARHKMNYMQIIRKKYRKNAVYKMGFLMSKIDNSCKTLTSVAFKLRLDCTSAREGIRRWLPVIDLLSGSERLLTLWFDVDLLIDLVVKNDENCRRMLNEVMTNRKRSWKFYD